MCLTFILTTVAWVFFRSPSLSAAIEYLRLMISPDILRWPVAYQSAIPLVLVMLLWEWCQRHRAHGLEIARLPAGWRRLSYLFLGTMIVWFGGSEQEFIYFQF